MNTQRKRRGLISMLSKAQADLADSVIHASKIERGQNLSAAKAFKKAMSNFLKVHAKPLHQKSKDVVKEISQRPKRPVTPKQRQILQITRSKIKK